MWPQVSWLIFSASILLLSAEYVSIPAVARVAHQPPHRNDSAWAKCALRTRQDHQRLCGFHRRSRLCVPGYSSLMLINLLQCGALMTKIRGIKYTIVNFRVKFKDLLKNWLRELFGRGCSREFPFYLLKPVLLELNIHLHALDRSRYLIIDPDFWIIEIIRCLEDLHKPLVYIDAFT